MNFINLLQSICYFVFVFCIFMCFVFLGAFTNIIWFESIIISCIECHQCDEFIFACSVCVVRCNRGENIVIRNVGDGDGTSEIVKWSTMLEKRVSNCIAKDDVAYSVEKSKRFGLGLEF